MAWRRRDSRGIKREGRTERGESEKGVRRGGERETGNGLGRDPN